MFAGFLELVVAAGSRASLLITVDDAQRLDRSSAECLGYAMRHLDGARVAVLVAGRPEHSREMVRLGEGHRLPRLSREDARAMLRARAANLGERDTAAILDAADGNPLALEELPELMAGGGVEAFGSHRAPGGALEAALRRRLQALPDAERLALLVAAASSDSRAAPVAAAVTGLGMDQDVLASLEEEGLLLLGEARIEFRHPMLRGVLYEDAGPSQRREAHRALAAQTAGATRAWHLAGAAIGFDDEAAAALEAAAGEATSRGAHETAAEALARAAELSSEPEQRSHRLFAAGLAAAMGGRFDYGAELLERAAETDSPQMRAMVTHLDALVALTGGLRSATESHRRLAEEADRIVAVDPRLAAAMLADAAVVAIAAGDLSRALELAEHATETLPGDADPSVSCQAHSVLGMSLALRGRTEQARESLDVAGSLLDRVDPLSPAAQSILFAMGGRLCTGQERQLLEEARMLADAARRGNSVGLLPYFQLQSADAAYRLGMNDRALEDSELAVEMAEGSHQAGPLSIALAVRSRALSTAGRISDARRAAKQGARLSAELSYASPEIWCLAALGYTELAAGRERDAVHPLMRTAELAADTGLLDPVIVPWAPDLVEACWRLGRTEDARWVVEQVSEQAAACGAPIALALAARCRGLTSGDDCSSEFDRALAFHDEAGLPMERARTVLAQGQRLLSEGSRGRARRLLREARDEFASIGARSWVRFARSKLQEAGAAETALANPAFSKRQAGIIAAVAEGATNKEIAAELMVSPKTVEYHLAQVYRKLGIRTRAELAALVAAGRVP